MKNKKKTIMLCIIAVLAVCLVICIFLACREFFTRRQAQRQLEGLREIYVMEEPSEEDEELSSKEQREPDSFPDGAEAESIDPLARKIDFQALRERENKDIYAWIMIPGTPVDYPVLQNDAEADYYLDHNLNGSRGYPGCIYTELYNSKEWDDSNTVLYGHNMKNGTMFGSLQKYADPEYFAEHSYVYVYMPDQTLVYQVFAAYVYSDEHLVRSYDFTDEEAFEAYLDSIYENNGKDSNFDFNVEVASGDRIITLSTCIKNKKDRRYLVQARLISEE